MLILTNDDVESLLTMADCLQALEEAYTELAAGRAQNRPRTDLYTPTARRDAYYVFKSMEGAITVIAHPPISTSSFSARRSAHSFTWPITSRRKRLASRRFAP